MIVQMHWRVSQECIERSWSALISLMKANHLTTAAIEIEKCLKMIVSKYPSSSKRTMILQVCLHLL